MSRILIIGGYGTFGLRLARRLARDGHEVLVAGRSLDKARAACGRIPGSRAIKIDRRDVLLPMLKAERPDIVVDAAGPFQDGYSGVVKACLEERVHYVDLADDREFVGAIGRFDRAAKATGVVVLSGASSVPALSGAVVAMLAEEMREVTAVDMAISASSRTTVGQSVAAAILSGVGKPMPGVTGGRTSRVFGWSDLGVVRMDLSRRSLGWRTVARVDVPDLDLLPQRFPALSAVRFRAGGESHVGNAVLWMARWPVQWGWLRSLRRLTPMLGRAHRVTALWGSDRSGMQVRLFGRDAQGAVERRWTLIAECGDGPEVPTLAAAILVNRVAEGSIAVGARPADRELVLDDFEPLFGELAMTHATAELRRPPPLYRRVMGDRFDRLSPSLRELHSPVHDAGATGRGTVSRGDHPLAGLIAAAMRFPPAGDYPVHVHFAEDGRGERWTRNFGGHRFSSSLSERGGLLVERFGALRFGFRLEEEAGSLRMTLVRWSVLGIPLPLIAAPRIYAREYDEDGRFRFEVAVVLPLIGEVVRYCGWLAGRSRADQNGTSSSRSVSNAAGWGRDCWREPPPEAPPPE